MVTTAKDIGHVNHSLCVSLCFIGETQNRIRLCKKNFSSGFKLLGN